MKSSLHKLFALFLLISFISCTKDEPIPRPEEPITLDCVKPAYLKAGDRVALISPSYHTPMENVEKTAEERVSDIRWALQDPSIKAIICNRGGYGSIQLIDKLTLQELKSSPKWLVGFSDICTLHGLFTRAGVMSVHGTMSSFLAAGGTISGCTYDAGREKAIRERKRLMLQEHRIPDYVWQTTRQSLL